MATANPGETPENNDNLEKGVVVVKTDDNVEVEIVDDTPVKDRGRQPLKKPVVEPTDDELEQHSASVRQRIKELTHARHDERREKERLARERDELEQLARSALEENKNLRTRYNQGAVAFAATATEAAESALKAAKAKLKKAHEDFDHDAIADAQEEVARATFRAEQAKNFKPTPLQEPNDELQQRPSAQPRVEADQKTLSWKAKNQWFGEPGFEEYTSYALGLHQRLVNSGVAPSSDEYFAQIDARMKRSFPELYSGDDDNDEPQAQSHQKQPPTVVAPANRSTAAGPGKVRLTQTQVTLARKLGLTPQQYAAEVLKAQKEGLI